MERNHNPNCLYITNGGSLPDDQISRRGYIQFEDRRHYIIHYNHHDHVRLPNYFEICGHELSRVSINVEINFSQFIYVLSRLRQPYARPLKPHEKTSCYPIFAHVGGYIRIGDIEFTKDDLGKPDTQERLQEAWEDYWDNA